VRIKQDRSRFQQILKGRIKQNLKKYITKGEMIGKRGSDIISIPVPKIELPRMMYDPRDTGGVGQGPGNIGDILGNDAVGGSGEAGEEEGQHIFEAEVTIDELTDMLAEEFELPNIEPKGKDEIENSKIVYRSIRTTGPSGLRNFKRTYKQALKRSLIEGTYNTKKPSIIPIKEDGRYRSFKRVPIPQTNAAIIYILDVSQSVTDESKQIIRQTSFWLNAWLKRCYKGVQQRYIIHDTVAKEVDEYTFFHTREDGGTMISSGLNECVSLIGREFNPADWNIYVFQFSDGDNIRGNTAECMTILEDTILPMVNLFCYGQYLAWGEVEGDYLERLDEYFEIPLDFDDTSKLRTSKLYKEDDIYDTLHNFLRTGR